MIILLGSNKGGSGKTTLACNLAVSLAKDGGDVCLVDADRQGSASRWNLEREASGTQPAITLVQKYDNLSQTLQSLDGKYSHVLVDVAGRNSREMITAATVADLMIAPHQCSQLDLDTLGELQEQVVRVMDFNPSLRVLVYQTMASTNIQVIENERRDFKSYVGEFPEFIALKSSGRYRKIYRDVMSEGLSVLETSNKLAIEELTALYKEVFNG
ncbi:MAG: division plane positioning ATPase MipZ [Endozoicomonas sp.]|uniref:division plane positioning ATPase MipZ n=1 Tax=Endozoicomonas sp. TaxID=1892382 RepID=UPI003D9B1968